MALHPEERRIAGLLRELIVQSGAPPEALEKRLGWESGHLFELLEGRLRLSFEDVLEILPLLGTTPTDFFAWLYGFDARESLAASEERSLEASAANSVAQQAMDRRFERSLKVVRDAMARRSVWKGERPGKP